MGVSSDETVSLSYTLGFLGKSLVSSLLYNGFYKGEFKFYTVHTSVCHPCCLHNKAPDEKYLLLETKCEIILKFRNISQQRKTSKVQTFTYNFINVELRHKCCIFYKVIYPPKCGDSRNRSTGDTLQRSQE